MNTPQLNGGTSHDFSASPSASSVSQHGPGSSCATSPEPSHNSPGNTKPSENGLNKIDEEATGKAEETYVCVPGKDGEASFCEKLNMACGNPHNPVPRAMSQSSASQTPATNNNGIEWLSQQNGGQFDPVLFGDYRDPADQSTPGFGTFFDDALTGLPTDFDFGSPAPVNAESHKKTLVEVLDEKDDEDEVVPADDDLSLLSCNKIWDKIQNDPRFQAGEIDVDNLCTELRQKAKCSETGVVVNEKDVNAVLLKVKERNAALSGSR
jgi:AP-1-like factor